MASDTNISIETGPGRPPSSLVFAVGRLDGKVDQILQALPAFNRRLDDIEGDVVELKLWQARLIGGAIVITFIISAWEIITYVYQL